MRLEYRLNMNDYREANRIQLKGIFVLLISILAITTIINPLINLLALPEMIDKALLSLLINLLIFLVILIALYWVIQLAVVRTWNSQPNLHDPISVEVNEDGWLFSTSKMEARADWQVFIRFHETKNIFMIYQSKVFTNLVPKRAFETEEQMNEFRALLQQKIVK